jgi:hypothetical protein
MRASSWWEENGPTGRVCMTKRGGDPLQVRASGWRVNFALGEFFSLSPRVGGSIAAVMNAFTQLRCVFVTGCSMLLAAPTQAVTLVTGGASLATSEGNTTSSNGFIGSLNLTSQLQIVASDLAAQGLQSGDTITGVRTRLESGGIMTGNRSISDFEITLAQAANALGSMSTTYASNMTAPVLVHDGAFTFLDSQMPEGSTPNAFGQLVSFTTPYTYQGGDLIFMFTRQAVTGGGGVFTDAHNGDGTIVRNLNVGSFQATTGSLVSSHAVLQLEFSSVPEPSRAVLLLGGLLGMALRRRRA